MIYKKEGIGSEDIRTPMGFWDDLVVVTTKILYRRWFFQKICWKHWKVFHLFFTQSHSRNFDVQKKLLYLIWFLNDMKLYPIICNSFYNSRLNQWNYCKAKRSYSWIRRIHGESDLYIHTSSEESLFSSTIFFDSAWLRR